jgi:hypothetical protein
MPDRPDGATVDARDFMSCALDLQSHRQADGADANESDLHHLRLRSNTDRHRAVRVDNTYFNQPLMRVASASRLMP